MLDLILLGTAVAVVGIAVILLATVFASRSEEGEEGKRVRVKGGGVVMVGPIPIIFGTDAKWTVVAIVLAIVLVVVSFLLAQAA